MSLAELKRKQQLRRQQQKKKKKKPEDEPIQKRSKTPSIDTYFTKPSNIVKSVNAVLSQPPTLSSPFAATPRTLRDNPFDIIRHEIDGEKEEEEEKEGVVMEEDDMVFLGTQQEDSSDDDMDPSLYQVKPSTEPLVLPNLMKKEAEEEKSSRTTDFSKPPESLSLRKHMSITSHTSLACLNGLVSDRSFLSLTAQNSGTLSRLANSLIYYEATPCSKTSLEEFKQSLESVYILHQTSPSQYPFVYLRLPEFTVVLKILTNGRQIAVISQSYFGLRKMLRNCKVDFTLPLAPKVVQNWSELDNTKQTVDDKSKYFLHSTSFDKSWRSALLITDKPNVDGLLKHLLTVMAKTDRGQSDSVNRQVFAPNPFLNAVMRRSKVRMSKATEYSQKQVQMDLYKLDITGMVFPNVWNNWLVGMAELLEEFYVAAKETSDTSHLNMFVSKQGSMVAGKRTVVYKNAIFAYQ